MSGPRGRGQAAPAPTSFQIARRVLARDAARAADGKPAGGAALERTCLRVSGNMRESLGDAGWAALLGRALAHIEADHPALRAMRRPGEGELELCGMVAAVEAHGVAAVTAAIEALLAEIIEILGRLIGEDMATRLIDHDAPQWRAGGGEPAP